jgi:hypothetical protein
VFDAIYDHRDRRLRKEVFDMTRNMGKTDRSIRAVVGIGILALGIVVKSRWGLIGIIPLGTAVLGWCPLYAPFKFSTAKKENTPPSGAAG